jgi:predicted AlkP superfamily pyrophosphatase or phosphodiesterase
MSFRAILGALICALGLGVDGAASGQATTPPAAPPVRDLVILVSIDGFRADYLQRGVTPTLSALATDGVRTRMGMRPSFPSVTFPNHYTLATGLFPDHHGIVANTMDDATITPDSHFTLGNFEAVSDGRWWAEGDPLWASAKDQQVRTATLFWPGSEALIHGVRPDLWAHFDAAMTPDQRVDIVLDWLDLPRPKRPGFVMLYFDQVDHEGHEHGPDSPEVNAAATLIDAALARLVAGLKARGLYDHTNLVIVADHGMAATSPTRVIYLDDYANASSLHLTTSGPVAALRADTPAAQAALVGDHPHMTCWRKADIPARLHYGTNPRIPPIVCLAEVGWMIGTRADAAKHPDLPKGEHGYDNADPLMAALFLARGPAFKRGFVEPAAFDNVDVYPLLADLLGVTPRPNDGRLSDIADMLAAAPR